MENKLSRVKNLRTFIKKILSPCNRSLKYNSFSRIFYILYVEIAFQNFVRLLSNTAQNMFHPTQ